MNGNGRFILATVMLLLLAGCSPAGTITLTVRPGRLANPFDTPGEIIQYSYVVTNTGINPLRGPVSIEDDKFQVSCPALVETGNKDPALDPGESITCTSTYSITQADLEAGSVDNNAIARISGSESNRVTNVVKTIQTARGGLVKGSTIQHEVTQGEWLLQIARCYGADLESLLIANPQVTDPAMDLASMTLIVPNIGSSGPIYGPPCIIYYTVGPGDTWQSIANMYNADLSILMQGNAGATLVAGMKIKVPLNSFGWSPAAAPLTPEEEEALIDTILKKTYTGRLTYTIPASVNLNDRYTVELHLTPSLSNRQIGFLLDNNNPGTITEEPNEIVPNGTGLLVVSASQTKITPQLKAVLLVDKEAIDLWPLDDQVHVVGSNISTSWQWEMAARKARPQKMVLIVSRLVMFDEAEDWRPVEIYRADIDVRATPVQRMESVDWKWFLGFVLASIGSILGILNWKDNHEKKAQPERSGEDRPVT